MSLAILLRPLLLAIAIVMFLRLGFSALTSFLRPIAAVLPANLTGHNIMV